MINNRHEKVREVCKGKRVMDVGCANEPHRMDNPTWMHRHIFNSAKYCVGVDKFIDGVKAMQDRGFTAFVGDVTTYDSGEKWEVITAIELIEHLSNIGLFLDNMHRQLKDDGILVLTTPNRYSWYNIAKIILFNECYSVYRDYDLHTCYFDEPSVYELFNRHGFKIKRFYYMQAVSNTWKQRWFFKWIVKFRPQLSEGLFIVAEKNTTCSSKVHSRCEALGE